MKLHQLIKHGELLVQKNSPAILTAVGVAGTLTTAYLTGKASFKAADILRIEKEEKSFRQTGEYEHPVDLTKGEALKHVWKLYIPAATSATITCSAIVFAHRINTKRLAGALAALSVSERAYSEYKDKVVETLGKGKDEKIRDAVAQDRMKNDPSENKTIYFSGNGDHLIYEQYMGHYTRGTAEDLKRICNEMNATLLNSDYVSLSDWYNQLGIPATSATDTLGWRSDKGLIEIDITTTLSDKEEPCLAFDFRPAPRSGYDLSH